MSKYFLIITSLLFLTACDQQTTDSATNPEPSTQKETAVIPETVAEPTSNYEPSNRSGKVIFDLHCAGCHDSGNAYAATKQLALVRGEDLAVIRERTDLVPDYIKYIVRDGLLEMPPFRPTDINDKELDNLAAYIVDSAKAHANKESK
ncbi:cytochrome c [Cycloclasticus sp.]|uniref:c-type cytochrome n=1 Tax=Cycloclasticus sp. TaxID=2024830 RepID=UPI000C0F8592|nr:cytochrome c [Cycloclasticus sp.]PHR51743.1 MAG: p-cresol methylhydroxylase [Cycloclasticus sp.]|tara:strand:- start:2652 stop:3095 length:444 start_codon:yes stop_codon:yes gene_type:complete